jgi:hypothetical protein
MEGGGKQLAAIRPLLSRQMTKIADVDFLGVNTSQAGQLSPAISACHLQAGGALTGTPQSAMAPPQQKKRKHAKPQPPQQDATRIEEEQDVPAAAAGVAADEPTGWEELDQPQDVQQQAGSICRPHDGARKVVVPGTGRPGCSGRGACMLPPASGGGG